MRIGIDIGGTFTDFVLYDPDGQTIETFKLPSTPGNPAEAVMAGLGRLDNLDRQIIHGSTVATNALLERKGAPTALVTTRGFADVLQIGRQNRPELYNLFSAPPPPLVPADYRMEVDERVDKNGEILTPLDPTQVKELIPILKAAGITSVAVCLLFSFLHPEHEQTIEKKLRQAGFFVSLSSEILPEFREYERTSTTVVNAYVSPIMDLYLGDLAANLNGDDLRIMQSNGGSISADEARRNAVRCILSGPAGGAVGAQAVAAQAGFSRIITFDMGGTSTDVSLIDGSLTATSEASIGGCPISIPILDIHTVGSGGGSIAKMDAGGALRVGPQSAGADPGPACYGRGELPTVTDANLVLGRLPGDHFLGGEMALDSGRAHEVISRLGDELGISPDETALGIVAVANAHMGRALRVISVERGHDPQDFTLVSFGGAGGLHAADLARGLGIPKVLVPPHAATLSALGMLMADVVKDYAQTVMLPGNTSGEILSNHLNPLAARGRKNLTYEGVQPDDITIEMLLDVRYRGQSYELTVPFGGNIAEAFRRAHLQAYGYIEPDNPLEIVNVRVKAIGSVPSPVIPSQPLGSVDPNPALLDRRKVTFPGEVRTIPFYRGESLHPNNQIPGPAVVVRSDTTVLIGRTDHAEVDEYGNILITVGAP